MPTGQRSVDEIFAEAIRRPQGSERANYLDEVYGQDTAARERMERLLRAHGEAHSFLEVPAADPMPTAVHEAPLDERAGTVIGPYKLLQQIGEGGMGVVFMAEQTEPIQRRVALKIIKPGMDTRQVIARFEAERQALAMMDHPNIAKVLDAGTTESSRPYFVMELVKGVPITEYCDQQQLSIRQRLELMTQVCRAVQHAHQKGIIHRDLKPSNVLVAEYDGKPVPKIIDFGVAKATAQRLTERTMFTQYGQIVGTIEYMSPEQARFNQLDVDTRSDVYSLGVLVYEVLAGSTPLAKERLHAAAFDEMLRIIREEEPPRPSLRLSSSQSLPSISAQRQIEPAKLKKLVRGELDWIVMKCLEKDRNRRYETASALAADIQHYLNDEAVSARPSTRTYRLKKFIRRNKAGVLAGSAIAVALLVGLALATIGFIQARREAIRADREATNARAEAARSKQVSRFLKDTLAAAGPSVARGRDATLLREILDKTADRVDKDLPDQPEVRGDLWSTLGTTYKSIGDYPKSVILYQHAVDSYHLALGNENIKLAVALGRLGRAQSFTSDVTTGKSTAQLGLDMARKCGDPETLATCLVCLASSMNGYGKSAPKAEPLWREALLLQRQLGGNPLALAECLDGLAGSISGDHEEEVEPLLREALALCREQLGTDHPGYAAELLPLGELLLHRGKLKESEAVLREAHGLYRKFHDLSHPYQSIVLRFLVQALENQGKRDESEAIIRQDIESAPTDANPHTVFGALYTYRAEWSDAADELLHSLELSPEHPWLRLRLSGVLLVARRYDDYRTNCHRLLGDTMGQRETMLAVEAALVLPVDGADFDRACQITDAAVTAAETSSDPALAFTVKALAEYRRGRFESACNWADRASNAKNPSMWVTDRFIQAAAYAKLERMEAARDSLAKGNEREYSIRPTSLQDFWDGGWYLWILTDCLRREAAESIEETSPVTRPQPTADKQRVDDKAPNADKPKPISPPKT